MEENEEKIDLNLLKRTPENLIQSVDAGNMVGILSKNEVMYTFVYDDRYQCFIHPLGAEEGRKKTFDRSEASRSIIKNLATLADELFEIKFGGEMDFMGVMVAAERGIINYLDVVGRLPVEDHDFMATD